MEVIVEYDTPYTINLYYKWHFKTLWSLSIFQNLNKCIIN